MSFLRRTFLHTLLLIGFCMVSALPGFAQVTLSSFSLTWNGSGLSELVQGDCFDLNAGPNAGGISLDISYTINGSPGYIDGWPTLDGSGQAANICLTLDAPTGPRVFLQVRDHANGGGPWFDANYAVTIVPQATSGSFNQPSGYAGLSSYLFYVGGVSNRNVRIRYNHDSSYDEEGVIQINGSGYYDSGPLNHYDYLGNYLVTAVQDAAAQPDNWTSTSAPYTILPPQPYSFSVDKSTVVPGGANGTDTFHMFAQNGAAVALDYQYTIAGAGYTDYGWPYLYPDDTWSWNGHSADIVAAKCTQPSIRQFTAFRNTLNSEWVNVSPPVQIEVTDGVGAPGVSSTNPLSANRGQSVTVTLYGHDLCGVSLSASGVTFSNVQNESWLNGTAITATFNVSASASVGYTVVTLQNRSGATTNFTFGITQSGAPPTVSGISPSSAAPGSSFTATITGSNLVIPVLSTTWSGLTFSNVVPAANGTSLTATFTIAGSAPLGNPPIKVTTPSGFVTTTLFAIGSSAPSFSRDYIYLGGRVIAADSP